MGLSDVISDVLEELWAGIEEYPYAEIYRRRLIEAIARLESVRLRLDAGGTGQLDFMAQSRMSTKKRWSSRSCGKGYAAMQDEQEALLNGSSEDDSTE
jgi:hypothetical protein